MGSGLVVYDHLGNRLYEWKIRLNHETEIFQAELRALREAIQLARDWGVEVDIFLDCCRMSEVLGVGLLSCLI